MFSDGGASESSAPPEGPLSSGGAAQAECFKAWLSVCCDEIGDLALLADDRLRLNDWVLKVLNAKEIGRLQFHHIKKFVREELRVRGYNLANEGDVHVFNRIIHAMARLPEYVRNQKNRQYATRAAMARIALRQQRREQWNAEHADGQPGEQATGADGGDYIPPARPRGQGSSSAPWPSIPKRHDEGETDKSIFCQICEIRLNGAAPYAEHVKGRKHRKKLKHRESSHNQGNHD